MQLEKIENQSYQFGVMKRTTTREKWIITHVGIARMTNVISMYTATIIEESPNPVSAQIAGTLVVAIITFHRSVLL